MEKVELILSPEERTALQNAVRNIEESFKKTNPHLAEPYTTILQILSVECEVYKFCGGYVECLEFACEKSGEQWLLTKIISGKSEV